MRSFPVAFLTNNVLELKGSNPQPLCFEQTTDISQRITTPFIFPLRQGTSTFIFQCLIAHAIQMLATIHQLDSMHVAP